MNTRSKGIRIYSWTRFIIFMAILVLIAFLAGGLVFKSTVSGMEDIAYETVVVTNGDTIWEIAKEYGDDDTDIRNIVHEICSINDISAESLYPGQTLKVPIG